MPDVLLVQPPIRDFYLTAKRTIPYGLACIASSLMEHGFSVGIFDGLASPKSRIIELPPEMQYLREYYPARDLSPFSLFHDYRHYGRSFEQAGQAALDSRAFLVGISSLFSAYSGDVIETAQAVKRAHPNCRVVVGGHHATAMPEAVLACDAVDFVLRGEGEESMPLLAKALRQGKDLSDVPGIAYRLPDGKLFARPPATLRDLDAVPIPAFELVDNRYYSRKGRAGAVIVASRGCPFRCSYCSVGGAQHLPFRLKSTAAVLIEMERAVFNNGARFIDFEDENLSHDRAWFLELLRGIK